MGTLKYLKNGSLQLLGNIQTEYNLSFAIDGTKDSAKIEVVSFSINEEIMPNTIVLHEDTNTWWVVSNDKVEYYVNENEYLYKHILKLQGLVELLNARDLTDCGFFADNYTIREFISRLFKLSTFEYNYLFDITNANLNLSQIVDYTKSFENYTLLSALREFLDGYSMSITAYMTIINSEYTFVLKIIPKTGVNGTILNENVFNNVKQTRTIDKNSYGTTVVSNAESVISTKAKIYPSVGTVKLKSNEGTITRDNAILRLPSNIYKINYLQMVMQHELTIISDGSGYSLTLMYDDEKYIKETILEFASDKSQTFYNNVLATIDNVVPSLQKALRTTFYTGWSVNPITGNWIPPKDSPNFYFPQFVVRKLAIGEEANVYNGRVGISLKELTNTLQYPIGGISYERGKDYIEDFKFLANADDEYYSHIPDYNSTDLRQTNARFNFGTIQYNLEPANYRNAKISNVSFRVNYIPMNDLKVKYDNSGVGNDIQLYNQNGKLTDSVAFSKLLLSYSKEIESDNITKYGAFYNFDDVPKVGKMVNINNSTYVINNVALDFYLNENSDSSTGLYIVGEFTLSKKIATKSLMVNPNTNIRDYGIPQNLNVKRKQLYRDFYELSHVGATDSDTDYYLPIQKILNLSNTFKEYQEHIGVIKITYDENIGGDSANNIPSQRNWYYQLDTTTYIMKKSIYEVIDFKDNNIIGYGSQNIFSGFDITRVLTGFYDTINTPISYVDEKGRFKDIRIAWCSIAQLTTIYDDYKEAKSITTDKNLYNYSCLIDSEIYEGVSNEFYGAKDNSDFVINELNYNKDAIEVPVFEYSCQIDDSDDVIVGDNIFNLGNEQEVYFYSFALVDKNTINQNNFDPTSSAYITPTYYLDNDNNLIVVGEKTNNNQGIIEFEFEQNTNITRSSPNPNVNIDEDDTSGNGSSGGSEVIVEPTNPHGGSDINIDEDDQPSLNPNSPNDFIRFNFKESIDINVDTQNVDIGSSFNINTFVNKDIVVIKNIATPTKTGNEDIYYGNSAFEGGLGQELTYDSDAETFYLDLTALGYFPSDFNINPSYLTPSVSYMGFNGTDVSEIVDSVEIIKDSNDHYIMCLNCTVSIPLATPISIYFDVVLYAEKSKSATFKKELMFVIKNNDELTSTNYIRLAINHYRIK